MRYKTLLFDADGTLLDFKKAEKNAIKTCFAYFGIPNDDATVGEYSRINDDCWKRLERGELKKDVLRKQRFDEFCEKFGYSADTARLSDMYTEELSDHSYLIDGAPDICQRLYGKCRMYIITNGLKTVQEKRFGACQLKPYFEASFISEEIGYEKPSKKFFDIVASKIPDFDPGTTLVIGDSLTSDIRGGNNAGLDTCWFDPDGRRIPDDMSDLNINYIISSLDEIESIVG